MMENNTLQTRILALTKNQSQSEKFSLNNERFNTMRPREVREVKMLEQINRKINLM